jgi:hypothetical protein
MFGKVVTTSEQSGITMSACQVGAQIGIAEWLANGPYQDWKLHGYKCVSVSWANTLPSTKRDVHVTPTCERSAPNSRSDLKARNTKPEKIY